MKQLLLLLFMTTGLMAQNEKCGYFCHNGTVIKALNETSVKGHIKHGDAFIGTCADANIQVGGACDVLTAEYFDFKQPLPIGEKYILIDNIGRVRKEGRVEADFLQSLPKNQVFFIKIKGYKLKKLIINN